jgi:hypothetical protein
MDGGAIKQLLSCIRAMRSTAEESSAYRHLFAAIDHTWRIVEKSIVGEGVEGADADVEVHQQVESVLMQDDQSAEPDAAAAVDASPADADAPMLADAAAPVGAAADAKAQARRHVRRAANALADEAAANHSVAVAFEVSSYPTDLFVPAVKSRLTCAICTDAAFEPLNLLCGHLFCGACIKGWSKQTCPQCRVSQRGRVGRDTRCVCADIRDA